MMSLFDKEEVMRSYIKSERYEAEQDKAKRTALHLLKLGKMSLEDIAEATELSLDIVKIMWGGVFVTTLRESAIRELEKLPEDKINFVLQIMQGVNGLYNDNQSEKKEAFARLEQLRWKGTVTDYDAELAFYRGKKYGK